MARLSAGFSADSLVVDTAKAALSDAAALESMAATIKALVATRLSTLGAWKASGHRSAEEELAKATGSPVNTARQVLDTGRRLGEQPEVRRAALSGEISPFETALITDAGEADPRSCAHLLQQAREGSFGELRECCAKVKAAARTDPDEHRRKIHERRCLRSWTDTEGVWHLAANGNPERGAQVMAALGPLTNDLFAKARKEGRREPPVAYAFDALVDMAMAAGATGAGGTPNAGETPGATNAGESTPAQLPAGRPRRGAAVKLLVRIDYDAFLRGIATEGETCEIVGYGPVSVSAVKELLGIGDPFVSVVLTRAKAIVGVAHLGRQPSAHQQSALEWLYPSCAAKGCSRQAHLERDHRLDWAKSHFTAFDLLDLLCSFHHGLKTRENWALVEGTGKRDFVAPGDGRHPRHRRALPP